MPALPSPSAPPDVPMPDPVPVAPEHCHLGRQHNLTENGAAWVAELTATCTHFDALTDCRTALTQGVPPLCYAGCIIKDLSSSAHSSIVQGHVEVLSASMAMAQI